MEIEMGESIMFSWLRHVRQCSLVQLNWKYSPKWEKENITKALEIKNLADNHFKGKHGWDIFKKSRNIDQIIQQAEIDALGLSTKGIFAIDVAYHGDGLNYGDAQETCSRVIKKLIRMSICMVIYFPKQKANCIFASPKINPAILPTLTSAIQDANNILSPYGIECGLLCNEEFFKDVYLKVTEVSGSLSDGSELFLRSLQLIELTKKFKNEKIIPYEPIIPGEPTHVPTNNSKIEILKSLKTQTHQSWVNLRKAVNRQLGMPYSFGTRNVENAAISFLNKCKLETQMSDQEILNFLDQKNLGFE